jgi:hypothetical protein
MNVWIAPVDAPDAARPLTREKGRPIPFHLFARTSGHILYGRDISSIRSSICGWRCARKDGGGRRVLRWAGDRFEEMFTIVKSMLIGHGLNDPRCKIAESDQIVAAMRENNIPVTYVVFPDEGHGFARLENRLAAITEAFLARHLGGRARRSVATSNIRATRCARAWRSSSRSVLCPPSFRRSRQGLTKTQLRAL